MKYIILNLPKLVFTWYNIVLESCRHGVHSYSVNYLDIPMTFKCSVVVIINNKTLNVRWLT